MVPVCPAFLSSPAVRDRFSSGKIDTYCRDEKVVRGGIFKVTRANLPKLPIRVAPTPKTVRSLQSAGGYSGKDHISRAVHSDKTGVKYLVRPIIRVTEDLHFTNPAMCSNP
jgi:hypothetical protein